MKNGPSFLRWHFDIGSSSIFSTPWGSLWRHSRLEGRYFQPYLQRIHMHLIFAVLKCLMSRNKIQHHNELKKPVLRRPKISEMIFWCWIARLLEAPKVIGPNKQIKNKETKEEMNSQIHWIHPQQKVQCKLALSTIKLSCVLRARNNSFIRN